MNKPVLVRCERVSDLHLFDCLGESGLFVHQIDYVGARAYRARVAPVAIRLTEIPGLGTFRDPAWSMEGERWLTSADFPMNVLRGVEPPLLDESPEADVDAPR
jgi:hypothetical protein